MKLLQGREYRTFAHEIRVKAEERQIFGHAAVFNSLSEPMWGFRERIAPGAFDDVLNDDVRALFNHDANLILGRTTAKTLRLTLDDSGLVYEVDAPDTQYARDLIQSMNRGDITQSSFGFSIAEDDWEEEEDGIVIRTILKVKRLYDVSPVTYPAYQAADSSIRSLEGFQSQKEKNQGKGIDFFKRRLRLIELSQAILIPQRYLQGGKHE